MTIHPTRHRLALAVAVVGLCLTSACSEVRYPDEAVDVPTLRMIEKTSRSLGAFDLVSGTLVATDPSYDLETARIPGLGAIITNCETGRWNAQIILKEFEGMDYSINSELLLTHVDYRESDSLEWRRYQKGLGVDSGQAGAWDISRFQDQSVVPKDVRERARAESKQTSYIPFDPWYQWCCETTLNEPACGVMAYGVVSRSGYGDGGYPVFVCVDENQKVIGVRIQFIDDEGRG